jgi:transcriptional regulator with XRE-family HTH domain
MSLDQLAVLCGLSGRGASGAWESGASSPDLSMLLLLADFYGVTLDYLFGLENAQRDSVVLRQAKAALAGRLTGVDWTRLSIAERMRETWHAARQVAPFAFPPGRIAGLIGGLEPESFTALVNAAMHPSPVVINRFAWALGLPEQLLLAGKWT